MKEKAKNGKASIFGYQVHDPQRFGINTFSKIYNYYWAIFISIYLPITTHKSGTAI